VRNYPHKPSEAVFQRNLLAAMKRLVPRDDITPKLLAGRNERFLPLNAKWALECACRSYALERDQEIVLDFLRQSNWSFKKAIETQARVNLWEVITHLSVALILRDNQIVKLLSEIQRERYENPNIEFPESTYALKEAEADIAAGRDEAAAKQLEKALSELASEKLPRITRDELESALLIAQAIVYRSQDVFDSAIEKRHASYIRKFSNPEIRNMPEGAIDIWGLGLARLAMDKGLTLKANSVYLPPELLGS